MMPNPCHSARRWLLALALWASAFATGCGPGVGGTGTGSSGTSLDEFGATAAALCSSELAPVLNCSDTAAMPAPPAGAPVFGWADDGAAPRVTARIEGNHIEFDAWCAGLRFSGDWGAIGDHPPRFYGSAVGTNGQARAAMLRAELAPGGMRLTLQVAEDALLMGPVLVHPVTMPARQPQCN